MASSYEDPAEVIEYFKNDAKQRQQIEAVVLEDQVVDFILASAKVTDKAVSYEELLKEQQARQQG
jgi:trigger factor